MRLTGLPDARWLLDMPAATGWSLLSRFFRRQTRIVASSIEDFVTKALSALANECHLLIVDLYPPGPFDPQGIHGCIWAHFDPEDYRLPDQKSLTLAAYVASNLPEAYLEHVTVGDELPVMPLFLDRHSYINVPLATTYKLAFRGVPSVWREVLETRHKGLNGC
jgi:hypothetical protein